MRAAIHQYKLRLTNLSQGNRSLKLGRLSKRKDLDITVAAFANKYSSEEIVARIVAGKSVDLLRSLSARDEKSNLLDRHLNKLYREVTTIYAETGTDDLFLGYPFVEGRFLDGSIARCPLLLFPVRLVRDFQRRPRWRLEVPKEEDVTFNKTFFLAYEKFQEVRLSDDFWDSQLEHFPDIQELLNHLYQFFKDEELQINFNSELFQYKVARFMDKNKALLEKLPAGLLKLQPNAVLGIFPQSDSALLQDYEALESQAGHFKLKEFFQAVPAPSIETYVKEDQRYFVTAVDHSQEEALLRIHHDQSVVVHGPPGTGKSQVILNLIADALARGQKVLVCSQKRAALDVVFHRLHKIGLSRFAVLVHDYRGDRNKIFRQIRKQIDDIDAFREERMDLNLDKWMRDFRLDSRKIDDHNHFFEALYSALTTVGRYGLSPHQLYLLADSQLPLIDLGDHPRQFDYGKMLRFTERLLDLLSYQEFFQKDHPWRQRLSFHSHGFNVRDRLREKLAQLPAEIDALHASAQKIAFLDEPFEEPEEIDAVIVTYSKLVEQLKVPGTAIDFAAYEGQGLKMTSVRSSLAKLERIFKRIASFRILDDFSLLLYHDLAEHFANYEREKDNLGRFFSLSWMRGRWYLKAILSKKDRLFKEEDFKEFKQELEVLHRLMRLYHVLEKDRFFADLPLTDTPERMLAWHGRKVSSLATIKAIREVSLAPPLKPRFRGVDFDAVHWEATVRTLDDLAALSKLLHATFLKWRSWLHNGQIRLLAQGMFQVDAAKSFADALASTFAEAFEDLRGLDNLIQELNVEEKQLLVVLADEIGKVKGTEKEAFLRGVENSFLLSWIELMEAHSPVLAEVSSRRMPRMREDFRQKVSERQEKVVQLILRKLKDEILDNITYNRLKNPVTYRDIGHQVRKQRLLWSVRQLIREFWDDGLSRLMPCWLASPESVAAVFPMEKAFFDLVIFDEASQCYVERALPVMLRGKNCVIAGDDKQLPPFDMYNVKVEDSEAAFVEDEMAIEVESALDLARNIFAECKLMWHYRSQEEELINFSNHAFYDGRLNIIPPARAFPEFIPPIEFLRVEGFWKQNRNFEEAQHVVELVETLIQRKDQPSIGIVTFNYFQKELIRDLMDQRLQALSNEKNEALLALLTNAIERKEDEEYMGIFVKNIENVQGDERDIIIFSVGYAHNEKGKLVSNFGLLSQKGGENRLNVAITRARKKVYVACSFDPETLSVEGAKYPGPILFKRYLQYAQAISMDRKDAANRILAQLGEGDDEVEDGGLKLRIRREIDLADRIAHGLEAIGLSIKRNVGDTNYKVDLAVLDREGNYILGIECEGKNFFNGRSSKEREVYRTNLLEGRGWKVHRVWARNYFMNPNACIQEIEALVKAV